jgi:hypothetical protein
MFISLCINKRRDFGNPDLSDFAILKIVLTLNFVCELFFFDKSKYYIKKRRGAQPLVHWKYTKGTREREKIMKENLQS